MRRGKQIGLAVATLVFLVVAPYPNGQSVSHSPIVITAETEVFKLKPQNRPQIQPIQPTVYCYVAAC